MTTLDFEKILLQLTTDSKDDGKHFIVTDRIQAIKGLLSSSKYQLQQKGDLCLIYSRNPLPEREVVLVSSHIDCVYQKCFCKVEDDFYKGTFDNSMTNAAVVYNMLNDTFPEDTVIAFTGDEEKDSAGCWEVLRLLKGMNCTIKGAVVTDVTNEGWKENCAFTLENDLGIDLITAHQQIEHLKPFDDRYVLIHEAEPDESWDLDAAGIPCVTLCSPVLGDMHSDEGSLARKKYLPDYCKALEVLVNTWCQTD